MFERIAHIEFKTLPSLFDRSKMKAFGSVDKSNVLWRLCHSCGGRLLIISVSRSNQLQDGDANLIACIIVILILE